MRTKRDAVSRYVECELADYEANRRRLKAALAGDVILPATVLARVAETACAIERVYERLGATQRQLFDLRFTRGLPSSQVVSQLPAHERTCRRWARAIVEAAAVEMGLR